MAKKPPVSQFAGLKNLSDKTRATLAASPDATAESLSPQQDFLDSRPGVRKNDFGQHASLSSSLINNIPLQTSRIYEEKPKRRGRPAGKRSNPEFEQTTLFLRKDTKRTANRLLEDHGSGDLSSLVERLLSAWAKKQKE